MRRILSLLSLMALGLWAGAQDFDTHFMDRTLRLDYSFCGTARSQEIYLDEMCQSPGWYGRRGHLAELLLVGNGQITVTDTTGTDTLYRHSFSTLFQEWQTSEEASRVRRSFENVFLIPFPRHAVDVTVTLSDTHNRETSRLRHRVNPEDILIRRIGEQGVLPWRYIHQAGDPREKIDVAIVAEGYTQEEMPRFYEDCQAAVQALLGHEPFRSLGVDFNFVAVPSASVQSGISVPHDGLWVQTALGSHYDTFYSERYLTTLRLRRLHDVLAGVPYEHIIILANTETYGGGGIYNSYMMSSAHHATAPVVLVHEFGHSFAGLADEYYYDDQYEPMYPADTEPWEPNLTTLVDFSSKWADLLPASSAGARLVQGWPVSAEDGRDIYTHVGLYEGGGYQSRGVYRPTQDCRMKTNEAPVFCPVCDRSIRRLVDFYVR